MKDTSPPNSDVHDHHHDHGMPQKRFVDPVCGMSTDDPEAFIAYEQDGKTYYFCSTHCLETFKAGGTGRKAAQHEETKHGEDAVIYTCPMHPEIHQDHPGSCPKCGMALEPETPVLASSKVEYTCPMHPEVVRDAPSSCCLLYTSDAADE